MTVGDWQLGNTIFRDSRAVTRGRVEFSKDDAKWPLAKGDGNRVFMHRIAYKVPGFPCAAHVVPTVTVLQLAKGSRTGYAVGIADSRNDAKGFTLEIRALDGCKIEAIRVEWVSTWEFNNTGNLAGVLHERN